MRFIHGMIAIILCVMLTGFVPLAGAEELGSTDAMQDQDWSQLLNGMDTSSFSLETLFSEEVISGILGMLIALFLSFFGISLS